MGLENYKLRRKAYWRISQAVKHGKIPRASTLKCMECEQPADFYHHYLGYARINWMKVKPVCEHCCLRIREEKAGRAQG